MTSPLRPQMAVQPQQQPQTNMGSIRLLPGSIPASWQTKTASNHVGISWPQNSAPVRSSTPAATSCNAVASQSYTLPRKAAALIREAPVSATAAIYATSSPGHTATSPKVPMLTSGRASPSVAGSFTASPPPGRVSHSTAGSFTAAPPVAVGRAEPNLSGGVCGTPVLGCSAHSFTPAAAAGEKDSGGAPRILNDATSDGRAGFSQPSQMAAASPSASPRVMRWSPPVCATPPVGLRGSFGRTGYCSPRMAGSPSVAPLVAPLPIGSPSPAGRPALAALLSPLHKERRGTLAENRHGTPITGAWRTDTETSPRTSQPARWHGSSSPPRMPRANDPPMHLGSPPLPPRLPSAPATAINSSPSVTVSVSPPAKQTDSASVQDPDPVVQGLRQLRLPRFVPPSFEGPLPIPESPEDSPALPRQAEYGVSTGFEIEWGTATVSTVVADDETADEIVEEAKVKAKITRMIQEATAECESPPASLQCGLPQHEQVADRREAAEDHEQDIVGTAAPSSVCSYSSSEDEVGETQSMKGDLRLLSPATFLDDMCSPMPPEFTLESGFLELPPDPWTVPAPARLLRGRLRTPVDKSIATLSLTPCSFEVTPAQPEQTPPPRGRFDWSLVDAVKSPTSPPSCRSAEQQGRHEGSTGGCGTPPLPEPEWAAMQIS